MGATPQSVCRWRRESLHPKRKRLGRPPGRPDRLSASQRRRLVGALKRGAYAWGYAEDYWTLDRVAHLIWQLFHVRYRSSSVWYLLHSLGWSYQKPQRRGWTFERITGDPVLIRRLLEGDWGNDFLILKPGEQITASHDEQIICNVNNVTAIEDKTIVKE